MRRDITVTFCVKVCGTKVMFGESEIDAAGWFERYPLSGCVILKTSVMGTLVSILNAVSIGTDCRPRHRVTIATDRSRDAICAVYAY